MGSPRTEGKTKTASERSITKRAKDKIRPRGTIHDNRHSAISLESNSEPLESTKENYHNLTRRALITLSGGAGVGA